MIHFLFELLFVKVPVVCRYYRVNFFVFKAILSYRARFTKFCEKNIFWNLRSACYAVKTYLVS